jgi:hypothetical protein
MSDLVRDLKLTKQQAELLGFRLQHYNGTPPWIPEKRTRPIVGGETRHDGRIVEE